MAAGTSNQTYEGSLEVLMTQLAKMKLIADANLPFIVGLETQVAEEYRRPERLLQRAGILPQGGENPQGMEALGMPGGAPPDMGPMGPEMGGGMPMPGGMPPPMGGPGGMPAPPPTDLGVGGVPGVPPGPPPPNPADLAQLPI